MQVETAWAHGALEKAKVSPPVRAADNDVGHDVLAWCAGSRTPAMVTALDCSVLWCNDAALALLAERDHFCLRADKLTAAARP